MIRPPRWGFHGAPVGSCGWAGSDHQHGAVWGFSPLGWRRKVRRWGGHRKPLKIQPAGLVKAKQNNYYPPEERAAPEPIKAAPQPSDESPAFQFLLLTPPLVSALWLLNEKRLFAVPRIAREPRPSSRAAASVLIKCIRALCLHPLEARGSWEPSCVMFIVFKPV